jgi:signal transduction histidine kinase
MLHHPFFKYSFVILLIICSSYTGAMILIHSASLDLSTVYVSLTWFVSFYWLPIWASAVIIFTCRKKGFTNTIFEWLLTVSLMAIGNVATDQLLALFLDEHKKMGVFVILNGLLWGSGIYFVSRHLESKQKISQEKQARKQAQLQTLRYQLNPHFMFNSLNTISAYIHSNPNLADEVLHELADILRYSLDTGEEPSVSLQQELAIVSKYLNIEKARFGDRLIVSLDIPDELLNTQVPPLILQPIVENSIKHNSNQTALEITIKVSQFQQKNQQVITILISDNGVGFKEEVLTNGYSNGVGMKNLQLRMKQLPKGKISLSNASNEKLADNKKQGAIVMLEMTL